MGYTQALASTSSGGSEPVGGAGLPSVRWGRPASIAYRCSRLRLGSRLGSFHWPMRRSQPISARHCSAFCIYFHAAVSDRIRGLDSDGDRIVLWRLARLAGRSGARHCSPSRSSSSRSHFWESGGSSQIHRGYAKNRTARGMTDAAPCRDISLPACRMPEADARASSCAALV